MILSILRTALRIPKGSSAQWQLMDATADESGT